MPQIVQRSIELQENNNISLIRKPFELIPGGFLFRFI
nr:MAG TPA: hypothetical protein [Caudoviricetes sp.]